MPTRRLLHRLAVLLAAATIGPSAAAIAPPASYLAPASAAPSRQFLVVPGRSAGPVSIGMRLEQVEGLLGPHTKADLSGRTHWYEWKSPRHPLRSIAVETLQDTVVLISLAHDPRYRTGEGLGDGDLAAVVERVFGRPSSVIRLQGFAIRQYRRQGIAFVTGAGDRVTGIVVAPAVTR